MKEPAVLRIIELSVRQRGEAFVFEFQTAHEKASVERVETVWRGPVGEGVLYVRDRGSLSSWRADAVEPVGHTQTLVIVPGIHKTEVLLPEECGKYLGSFSDGRYRWHVFAYRAPADGTPAKSAQPPQATASRAAEAPRRQPERESASAPSSPASTPRGPGRST